MLLTKSLVYNHRNPTKFKAAAMSQTFFTADLHFFHKNIAKFCPHTRPQISDVNELNEYMIALWNNTVGVDDEVYNLGDLTFSCNLRDNLKVLSRLNGRHHLIFGNHDEFVADNLKVFLTSKKHDGNPVLSSAQSYLKLKLADKTLILFHYPMSEWEGCHQGYYHLHGHIHERMADVGGRILNVGFDLHGRLLSLQDVMGYLQNLQKLDYFKARTVFDELTVPKVLSTHHEQRIIQNDDEWISNQEALKQLIKAKLQANQTPK